MMSSLPLLKVALENAKVIKMGKYDYFVNPIQAISPPLKPELLREIVKRIIKIADFDVDRILTIEAMGIHVSTLVSATTDISLLIARKKKFGLPGELEIEVKKSYRKIAGGMKVEKFYVNSIDKGDKVLIIDDVISTGGTIIGLVRGLIKKGVIVKDIVVVMNRGNGPQRVKNKTGCNVKTLANIEIIEGKVKIRGIS